MVSAVANRQMTAANRTDLKLVANNVFTLINVLGAQNEFCFSVQLIYLVVVTPASSRLGLNISLMASVAMHTFLSV